MAATEGEVSRQALNQTLGVLIPPPRDVDTLVLYDVANTRYIIARCDPTGYLYVNAIVPLGVDVTDRWARQVGQVDLARVLGAALNAANPVIAGIYDAAGNRMPSMDVVARAGYVDVIPPTAPLNNQVTIAAPRVPLAGVATPVKSVTIESPSTNNVAYVGNNAVTNLNGYRLWPGATVSLDINDLSVVYVTGTAGNVISYIAIV